MVATKKTKAKKEIIVKKYTVEGVESGIVDLKDELKQFLDVDAVEVIEAAQRREYEFYINGGFNK